MYYTQPILERFYLLDTCGVHNLHGMPGVFSSLASAIAAAVAQQTGGVEYGQRYVTIQKCKEYYGAQYT